MPVSTHISDQSIKSPSRRLAEALRELLGPSPADYAGGKPVGSVTVERAYLPVFRLESTGETVVSLVPFDEFGQIHTREFKTSRQVSVQVSVQRLIDHDPTSMDGKNELDAVKDYSERVKRACLQSLTDSDDVNYAPVTFDSTGHDQEALAEWNQFAEIHTLEYFAIV